MARGSEIGALAPLAEEPIGEEDEGISKKTQSFGIKWLKQQIFHRKTNLKLLLCVMACPLSPVSVLPKQPRRVASTAEYIIQQFRATSGCGKMDRKVAAKCMFAAGRVTMTGKLDPTGRASSSQQGSFVIWQTLSARWLFDLKVANFQVIAGSDGLVAWRRTPWHGAHLAKGGVRPLRRLLQGLDPMTIAAVFFSARHIGEKLIDDEDCFVLRIEADASRLSDQSDSTMEVIEHALSGCFSERSGLLLHLEDTQLMRMQSPGDQAMFWRTTISSWMMEYSPTDGMMVARSGRSVVNLERFGAPIPGNSGLIKYHLSTIMEEKWTIDDVDFNVPPLSAEFFIPPEGMSNIS